MSITASSGESPESSPDWGRFKACLHGNSCTACVILWLRLSSQRKGWELPPQRLCPFSMRHNHQQLLRYTPRSLKLQPPPAFSNQYYARISEIPWYFPVAMTENARCIANATETTRWHLFLCWPSNFVGQIVFWAGGGMDFSLRVSEILSWWWLLHPWYEIHDYKTLSLTLF